MGAFKWIFGFLGWVTWGPIGAILGYVSGAAIERSSIVRSEDPTPELVVIPLPSRGIVSSSVSWFSPRR